MARRWRRPYGGRVIHTRDPYAAELVEFIAARADGSDARVTPADGVRAVEVASAALESLRTGRSIAC